MHTPARTDQRSASAAAASMSFAALTFAAVSGLATAWVAAHQRRRLHTAASNSPSPTKKPRAAGAIPRVRVVQHDTSSTSAAAAAVTDAARLKSLPLQVAVLNCRPEGGVYPDLFARLFRRSMLASSTLSKEVASATTAGQADGAAAADDDEKAGGINLVVYECAMRSQYPHVSTWSQFDAFLVTGSAKGVYNTDEWIGKLRSLLVELHAAGHCIVGTCFGQQLLCQALGGAAEQNERGWELGPVATTLTADAQAFLSDLTGEACPQPLTLQYSHGDWVPPHGLPSEFHCIGGTDVSPVQGVYFVPDQHASSRTGGPVLAFQGHPEFHTQHMVALVDRVFNKGVVRVPAGVDARKFRAAALGNAPHDTYIGRSLLRFVLRHGRYRRLLRLS